MFIINPLSGQRMDNLFSTHPDTANRIAALDKIAQAMEASGGGRGGFVEGVRVEDLGGGRAKGPWG